MCRKTIALAAVLLGAVGTVTQAEPNPTPPAVPGNIDVGTGHKLALIGHAIGTQNYICAPAQTAAGVDWFFIGPQATLFDDDGEQVATHFLSRNPAKNNALQATWQHSRDSSSVWATRFDGSLDPAFVAADAIEWLRLDTTGASVGPHGGDRLSSITVIQRINTVGGIKPPAAECTASTINTRKFVPYQADYYFYR
jgi:hypothetical protein